MARTIHQRGNGVMLFIGAALASWQLAMAETSYRVVGLSSNQAPGTDAEFVRFGAPVINAAGDVAFQAFLTGPTTDVVPHGIWVGTASGIRPLAIAGEEAPGTDEARFRTPGPPLVLTSNGQSLFYGQLLDQGGVTSDNDYGLWVGPPAGVQLAARRSAPAPGLPPGVNYNLFFANPHSSGVMGLSATLEGAGVDPSNDYAAWIGPMTPTGSLQLIARAGDSAPGLPAGSRFRVLGAPLLNSHGQLAMGAGAFNNELPPVFVPGIWGGMPHDLSLLAAANLSAPGAPGRHFSYFGEPRIGSSGHVAFMGYLNAETSEQQVSDVGIWVGDVDGSFIQPVAIEGQPAPEFGPNAVFRGSAPGDETYYNPFTEPVLSGSGRVAFAGTVLGSGIDFDHNDGIWLSDSADDSGPPQRVLVAREGDRPPGTPEGTRFAGIFQVDDLLSAFERPLLASTGQVAFEALTTGPLGEFGRGIWATAPDGTLQIVAHTGVEMELAPGDVRTIERLLLHAGGSSDDGYRSAFNDAGQLSFGVSFTDGTEAIVVATVVPEPSTHFLIMVGLASTALLRMRRTRPRCWLRIQPSRCLPSP